MVFRQRSHQHLGSIRREQDVTRGDVCLDRLAVSHPPSCGVPRRDGTTGARSFAVGVHINHPNLAQTRYRSFSGSGRLRRSDRRESRTRSALPDTTRLRLPVRTADQLFWGSMGRQSYGSPMCRVWVLDIYDFFGFGLFFRLWSQQPAGIPCTSM